MEDLLALNDCRPEPGTRPLSDHASSVSTPLRLSAWTQVLVSHPDQDFAKYILEGIQHGFRIGFNYQLYQCRPARRNMSSAIQVPGVVSKYLDTERRLGRVIVVEKADAQEAQVSPFGVIPKRGTPNGWRLILDLSSPPGHSVNDGIDPRWCSLKYASIEQAVRLCRSQGEAPLLSKLDIKSAYRIVPVHPDDRRLLGMRWHGNLIVDTALPFGLRSAPKIFSAVADALLWAMHQNGVFAGLHYLDDFLFVDSAGTTPQTCQLQAALHTCESLGVPVAPDKVHYPTERLTFLGVEIDTVSLQLRLPAAKVADLLATLYSWRGRRSCTKRELLSLIGQLHHAAAVVRPGRTFLRHLIDLSTTVRKLYHHIRLSNSARSDIEWWCAFLASWNGISYLPPSDPQVVIESDASGSWGAAAMWGRQWFQVEWPDSWSTFSIAVKELLPILFAAVIWGREWSQKSIRCMCDNAAVVTVINTGWCRDKHLMHLMRCLFFCAARFQFCLSARHIPGALNCKADALSRNKMPLFFSICPQARQRPEVVPQPLLDLAADSSQDWTSPHWSAMFNNLLGTV